MNVALIANRITMHERFNRDNIEILHSMGHNIFLISNGKVPVEVDKQLEQFYMYCSEKNITIIDVRIPRSPFRLVSLIKAYFKLSIVAGNHRIDFIHSHSPSGGLLARILSHRIKIPNIYTAHGFHFYHGAPPLNWLLYYPVEKWLAKKTSAIIAINNEDYDFIKERFATKTFYVPGVGIDSEGFSNPVKQDDGTINLVSVGELNKNKNHAFAITQLRKIKFDFKYRLAGVGNKLPHLNKLVKSSHQQERISFIGYTDNVKDFLASADIFIMPSKREGLPVALMEAMAAGLPILASNIRGNRELVDHGKGGYLYQSNNENEFMEYLAQMISDPALRKEMGQYNVIKAKNYDVAIVREAMKEIYLQYLPEKQNIT